MGALASCASLSVMGEVDGGKARGVEHARCVRVMWQRGRRGGARAGAERSAAIFFRNCGA